MIGKRFEVYLEDSFYNTMVGEVVFETDRTYLIEFKLNKLLGGTQRVMFFKDQVVQYSP